jgi:hypothetical protein
MQPNGHEPGYATLDDLLDRAQVELTEVNDGGHIQTIKVLNKADIDALILDDAFTARAQEVGAFVDQLKELDAYGAVVAVNGEIVALDLLNHRETFKKLWAMLVRGYAIDASLEAPEKPKSVTQRRVQTWLRSTCAEAEMKRHPVPGVGEYYEATPLSSRAAVAGERYDVYRVRPRVEHHRGLAAPQLAHHVGDLLLQCPLARTVVRPGARNEFLNDAAQCVGVQGGKRDLDGVGAHGHCFADGSVEPALMRPQSSRFWPSDGRRSRRDRNPRHRV